MPIFFHKSRRTFYYRSYVPRPLRRLLAGRREVWRSLDTNDKAEAKVRAASWDRRALQLYLTLRRNGDSMTEQEREALVSHWLEQELEYAEDCRALAGPVSDAHRESQLEGLSIEADLAHEQLLGNNYRKIEKTADDLLKAAGLPPKDKASAVRLNDHQALRSALVPR